MSHRMIELLSSRPTLGFNPLQWKSFFIFNFKMGKDQQKTEKKAAIKQVDEIVEGLYFIKMSFILDG